MIKQDDKSEYKQGIMIQLLMNENVLELLLNDKNSPFYVDPSGLIWKRIFPYVRIPGTQEETKCYIVVEVEVPRVSTKNYFFKEMVLTIGIITSSDWMETDYGGTRNDILSGIIIDMLDGNRDAVGNELELVSDIPRVEQTGKYYCRELRFTSTARARNKC